MRLVRPHRVERSLALERRLPREDPRAQIDPALRIRLAGRSVDDALDVLQRGPVGRRVGDCDVRQIFDTDVGHREFDRRPLAGRKGKAWSGIAVACGKAVRLEVWFPGDVRLAGAVPLDALPVAVVLLDVDGGDGDAGSLAAAFLEFEVLGQPEGLLAGVIGDVGRVREGLLDPDGVVGAVNGLSLGVGAEFHSVDHLQLLGRQIGGLRHSDLGGAARDPVARRLDVNPGGRRPGFEHPVRDVARLEEGVGALGRLAVDAVDEVGVGLVVDRGCGPFEVVQDDSVADGRFVPVDENA